MISDVIVNKSKSVLFLAEIQPTDKGIIKVYKGEKFIGFVVFGDEFWIFNQCLYVSDDSEYLGNTIIELHKQIVSDFGDVTYKFESIDE